MVWSEFFIKILGVNFGNSILGNSDWDKISESMIKKIYIEDRMKISLRGKKKLVNQILSSKLRCLSQIYTIPQCIKKENERIYGFLLN